MTNLHTIKKNADGTYTLRTSDGSLYTCTRWFENKPNKQVWHVLIPAGPAREKTGRTYVSEAHFKDTDIYSFETKTEHRTGVGFGGTSGWKSRMTDDEKAEYEALEKRMAEIEALAKARPARELTEEEKIEAQIARLQAKLQAKRAEKAR